MGRLHYSTDQIIDFKEQIIEEIANGESLTALLKNKEGLPTRKTVFTWLNPTNKAYDEVFSYNYALARAESAERDVEKMEDIVNQTLKGNFRPDAARVAINGLKWIAGRKKPKKYGNSLDLTINERKLTPEERSAKIMFLKKKMDSF